MPLNLEDFLLSRGAYRTFKARMTKDVFFPGWKVRLEAGTVILAGETLNGDTLVQVGEGVAVILRNEYEEAE